MNNIKSVSSELEIEMLLSAGKFYEALALLHDLKNKNNQDKLLYVITNIAYCYIKLKEFANAKEYLLQVLEINPRDTSSIYNLGLCYQNMDEIDKAIKLFENIKQTQGMSFDIGYNLGFCYLNRGQIAEALENYYYVLQKCLHPELIVNITQILIDNQYYKEARDYIIAYLADNPKDYDGIFTLGIAYQKQKEYHQAIECYRRILEEDEKYFRAYLNMGICMGQIGRFIDAVDFAHMYTIHHPEDFEGFYVVGLAYESLQELDKAIQFFKKASALATDRWEIWDKLGNLYSQMGDMENARISFKKAFFITQDLIFAYRMALIHMTLAEYVEALRWFLKCEGDSSYGDIDENLAICYFYNEDFSKAIHYANKALKSGKKLPLLYFIAGSSLMKTLDWTTAELVLREGLEDFPDDLNILYSLGLLSANREDYEGAVGFLEKALSIEIKPDILYALALSHKKLGNISQAIINLVKYMKFHLDDVAELYKLGLMFIELKDTKHSRKAFEAVLNIEPNHPKALSYLSELNK